MQYPMYKDVREHVTFGVKPEDVSIPIDRLSHFASLTEQMYDTYVRKNSDYGNSFAKSMDKWGLTAALIRMEDKFNRLESLSKKDTIEVNESIEDTLLDLANYAIMTIVELHAKGTNHVEESTGCEAGKDSRDC